MSKRIVALMAGLVTTLCLSAQNSTVNFNLTGVKDGEKVGLVLINGKNDPPEALAPVTAGKVTVKVDIPQGNDGRAYYVKVGDGFSGDMIVLKANETATATGEVVPGQYDKIKDFKLAGSPTNDAYQKVKLDRESLNKLYEAYHQNPALVKMDSAAAKKDTAAMARIRQTPDYKKFEADEHHFFALVDSTFKAVHKANAATWFGPLMILTDYSYLTDAQKPEYEQLSDEAKNSFYGKIVQSQVAPPSLVGKPAPDFTFTDWNTKKKTSLKAILAKNKYVLLDFWASWCRPCRAEIPNVKANYQKYHAKGFTVVSISADSKEADWLKALKTEKMPWPQDRDAGQGILDKYEVRYFPTTYLLDSKGRIVEKDIRGEALGTKLAELFK